MSEKIIPIPGRLRNVSSAGHVAGAVDIIDDDLNKLQSEINLETATTLNELDARIGALQEGTLIIVSELPTTGVAGKIYRVPGDGSYTDYMWDTSQQPATFVELATYTGNEGDFFNVNVYNSVPTTPYGNAALARGAVPDGMKKQGLQITYLLADGWFTDLYIGSAVDSTSWATASNWKPIGPVSVSQNMLMIGGQSTNITPNNLVNVNYLNNKSDSYSYRSHARAAVPDGLRKIGLVITYLFDDKWETEQYIGDLTGTWQSASNWKILTDMPVLNLNDINDHPSVYATKTAARESVPDALRKSGLIITYFATVNGGNYWNTEQYISDDITGWTTNANWIYLLQSQIDTTPTRNSAQPIMSGGVFESLDNLEKGFQLVAKKKTISPSWENYGVQIWGELGTSATFKHATIALNKGDIIKVTSTNWIGENYMPVSYYDGTKYIPRLLSSSAWKEFIYISDADENIVITSRDVITVEFVESQALGEEKEERNNTIEQVNYKYACVGLPNKAQNLLFNWENGQIDASGYNQENVNRRRSKDFINVQNLILLRVNSPYRVRVFYYDKDKKFINYDESYTPFTKVLNSNPWQFKQYNIKYIRLWIDNTDTSTTFIQGDSISSLYNNRRLLSNNNVECAAHQGILMHIQPDNIERSFGGNFLSSFWGAYLCGFQSNLVNHLYTSDGVPVCAHDSEVTDDNNVTFNISNVTFEQLETHTFGGEKIPTLDSVVCLSKMLGMGVFLVNMDIQQGEESKLNTVLQILDKYRMWDNAWLNSSGYTITQILNHNKYARIAILQPNISSTSYADIETAIGVSESVKTDYNKVMIWINSAHSEQNLIDAAMALQSNIGIGCYNVESDSVLATILPYITYYSSHYSSFGVSLRNVELGVATRFPTIIEQQNGNII